MQLYLDEEDGPSACIARTEPGPLHIRVDAAFLVHPDDRVLLFVLGHEMGHHIAHAPDRYRGADPRTIYRLFFEGRRAGVREVAAAFCRASELTADRIGLLACQDLDAAVRTFMALSTGEPAPTFAGHEQAYLAKCKEHAEQLLRQKNRGEGDTHPEVDVRVFALSAFAESDVYAALTGRGAGSRRLVDIDRILERLTGPSESARDEGLPRMPPSLVEKAEEEFSSAKQRVTAALRTGFTDLRNAATGFMGDATRRCGRDAVEERPPRRSEHGTIADPTLLPDPYLDDLERRFTDLKRRFDHNAVSGASQKQAPEPGSGHVEDLERQFAELEARMAARGCSEEPNGDSD
ncbi:MULTISPECIES: M48 family metalloprotease [Sorangium]|uniref:M48 family metalloprotease n=1 Tax=Sorangium TaxID=39643 RepID=UPI003D9C45F8